MNKIIKVKCLVCGTSFYKYVKKTSGRVGEMIEGKYVKPYRYITCSRKCSRDYQNYSRAQWFWNERQNRIKQ